MRSLFAAATILALVGMGCNRVKSDAPPSQEYRSEAEAEAARASQAKAKSAMNRPKEGKAAIGAPSDLTAPQPLAPANGSEFNQFPRKTTLKWSPVTGAVAYKVEAEYQTPDTGEWSRATPSNEIKATEYEFEFPGAQPGRWRVWAVDANGHEGPKSDWWTFRYTQ